MYFWKSVSTCTSANYIATSAEVSPNCGSRESPQMSLVRVQELNIHTYCILIFHLPRCMECWSFQLETFHQTHGFSPAKSQVAYCTCIVPPKFQGASEWLWTPGVGFCVCHVVWRADGRCYHRRFFFWKGGQFRCWLLWVSLRSSLNNNAINNGTPSHPVLPSKGIFPPIPKICNHHSSLRVPFQCHPWK